MKTTISGICFMAALTAVAGNALAQGADSGLPASRWSSSVMDRHMPLDAVQMHKQSERKFRYMDMAQVKRSSSIRNAVIVQGYRAPSKDAGASSHGAAPRTNPDIRHPSQQAAPIVVMRPMT